MSNQMFCNQCEQTAGGTGCTTMGVCGKNPAVAALQDELICQAIRLAEAGEKHYDKEAAKLLIEVLFVTITNVNFDEADIKNWVSKVRAKVDSLDSTVAEIPNDKLFAGEKDIVSLRQTLLYGLRR